MWGQRAKRNWGKCKNSLSRIPCPHPHPELTEFPPFLPHAPSPFPSNPLPSQVSFFSQQSSSQFALPDPISPPPTPPCPFQHPLPPPPIPFLPPPQWGGEPGGLAPSPARLLQRWWRVAVSLPRSGCRCHGGDRIWGCPSPGRWRGGGSGRLGP